MNQTIDTYLTTLYQVEQLLQTAIASRDNYSLEEALQLVNEIISESELNTLESEDEYDNENYIPPSE